MMTLVVLSAYAIWISALCVAARAAMGCRGSALALAAAQLVRPTSLRASGSRPALLVALLDITKGVLSVAMARYVSDQPAAPAAAGVAAIIGQI